MFSVKRVVCCCVYLNMQPIVDNSRSESNWFNWLKIGLGEEGEVLFRFVIWHFIRFGFGDHKYFERLVGIPSTGGIMVYRAQCCSL